MARGTAPLKRSVMNPGTTSMKRAATPLKAIGARAKRMRQGKVAPNTEEQSWMDRAQAFGCIVCYLFHGARTPAAIHHPVEGGRRKGHLFAIPLCDPGHHQNSPTPLKISRHPNKKQFELAYGSEETLLRQLKNLIELPQ